MRQVAAADVVATSDMRLLTIFNRDLWQLEEEVPELVTALRTIIARTLGLQAEPQTPQTRVR